MTTQQSASPQVGNVPFLDLSPSHEPLRDRMLASFADLIDSSAFANGPAIAEFERAFADVLRDGAGASASRAAPTLSASGSWPWTSNRGRRSCSRR